MSDNLVYLKKPASVLKEESLDEVLRLVTEEVKNGNVSSMILVVSSDTDDGSKVTTFIAGDIMQQDLIMAVGLMESAKYHIIENISD